ncbi:MAG: hypothetical protein Q8P82_00500 [bacterium]|nr:hypothetical protein [bacterium]
MNKESVQWLVLILSVIGLVGLGVIVADQNEQLAQLSRSLAMKTEITKPVIKTDTQNVFDPFKNKPGDTVAGLVVVSIGPVPGIDRPLALDNVEAKFSGTVTVSGTYSYGFSDLWGADTSCFTPDAEEMVKLPVLSGVSDQNDYFCFNNIDKAKEVFGPTEESGTATVVIDNYALMYAPAEVSNMARLVSVVEKKSN